MPLGPKMTVIAQIALDLPFKFTTKDLLNALIRAEQAGFDRAREEQGGVYTGLDNLEARIAFELECG